MSTVTLEHVNKIYPNGHQAAKDVNLHIEDGEFVVFVGPSGCGKSTVLRMIAGLEEVTSGEILIDGELVNSMEPKDRDIAMVFQNYALYPHMTVFENMSFALKNQRVPNDIIVQKVTAVAAMLGLEECLKSKPKELSGGQRQRVAMGRAIVRNPKVFLMDEPLSNLDAKLRVQMRAEMSKLHRDLQATILYVTHDQTEAMTLGSRIVVLKEGAIQQVDTPTELYFHPKNKFVAGFIGSPPINFIDLDVRVSGNDVDLVKGDISFPLPEDKAAMLIGQGYADKVVTLGIRPENIHRKISKDLSLPGIADVDITFADNLGSDLVMHFDLEGEDFTAVFRRDYSLKPGDFTQFFFDMEKAILFDPQTELAIC